MKTTNGLNNLYISLKSKNALLIVSTIYSYVWATYKIVFGAYSFSYFFCISGASTLLFGFIKLVYLKNYSNSDFDELKGKSITLATLLLLSSALFTFYSLHSLFIGETKEYGLITSLAIATFSFAELGISIFKVIKAKNAQNLLLKTFRGCNLASSCFAIVLTQIALLSTTKTEANFYNALTGLVFGLFAIFIAIYLLIYLSKQTKPTN